jgi:hypothetical protein
MLKVGATGKEREGTFSRTHNDFCVYMMLTQPQTCYSQRVLSHCLSVRTEENHEKSPESRS